jgi:hypothetical protein
MRAMMQKLKLTVNEAKTHVCRLPEYSCSRAKPCFDGFDNASRPRLYNSFRDNWLQTRWTIHCPVGACNPSCYRQN